MSEQIARQFHDVYERLAPQFGYETREDTKVFDPQSQNGRLMIAVCAEVIGEIERERDEARKAAAKWESLFDAVERAGAEQAIRANENREWALRAERERDEAHGALVAQDRRMIAAGHKCGVPFEVFGCDWPDRVAEELIAVAKERDEARKQLRVAVGLLSTTPQFQGQHPEEVLTFVEEAAK